MKRVRGVAAVGLAVILLVVAGAGVLGLLDDAGGEGTGAGGAASAVTSLEELTGTWTATEDSTVPSPMVAGTPVGLTFEDGKVLAETGCNNLFGAASVRDGTLDVEGAAGTLMGCPPERMAQEDWVREMLAAAPTIALDGDVLVLTWSGNTLRLTKD